MALPVIGKYALFLVIVFLIYTGYAFRIRDAGVLSSAEIGTCNSVTGKCPEKTVVSVNLPYKKYQNLKPIGKLAQNQPVPAESKGKIFGRTEKLALVKFVHGLRKVKVSQFESNANEEKDEAGRAVSNILGKSAEDEEDNTEEIEAESDKNSKDDINTNGEYEVKGDGSEEGDKEDKGAKEVESDKEDHDNEEKEGNSEDVSENISQQETHKHAFKLENTRLSKKPIETQSLNTNQFSSNDKNLEEKNLSNEEIETKTSVEAEGHNKNDYNQNNANLEDNDKKNDDNDYNEVKSVFNEEYEGKQVTLAPRKLEKVRLADKGKAKSIVLPSLKTVVTKDKPSDVQVLKNNSEESVISKSALKSELEKSEPKQTVMVERAANESEKENKSKLASRNPSTLGMISTTSKKSKNIVDKKKSTKPESKLNSLSCVVFLTSTDI